MTEIIVGRSVARRAAPVPIGSGPRVPASALVDDDDSESLAYRAKKRMIIRIYGTAQEFEVPYAPSEVKFTELGTDWEELAREGGRKPLLLQGAPKLDKMSFTLFLGSQDWEESCETEINQLKFIANSGTRISVLYSDQETGLWRITGLSITTQTRNPTTQEFTRADVEVEFTRTSDIAVAIGPVSGGSNNGGKLSHPATYRWKKGDTLPRIALRFYGVASAAKKIAKANKIKNPRKIKVGRVLRLP